MFGSSVARSASVTWQSLVASPTHPKHTCNSAGSLANESHSVIATHRYAPSASGTSSELPRTFQDRESRLRAFGNHRRPRRRSCGNVTD